MTLDEFKQSLINKARDKYGEIEAINEILKGLK